jgi:hypothetical protein
MEALNNALLVMFRWTEDEIAQGVNFNPSSFPELHQVSDHSEYMSIKTHQSIGELNVQVANMHRWRWLS